MLAKKSTAAHLISLSSQAAFNHAVPETKRVREKRNKLIFVPGHLWTRCHQGGLSCGF